MSIKKSNAAILRKRGETYTTLPNEAFKAIVETGNGEALAIWAFLVNKPPKWVVVQNQVMKSLGFGRVKFSKGVKTLESLGLWKTIRHVDDYGKVKGWDIEISTQIDENVVLGWETRSTETQIDGIHNVGNETLVIKDRHLYFRRC